MKNNQIKGNRKERRTHAALIRRAMKRAGSKYEFKPGISPQPIPVYPETPEETPEVKEEVNPNE